MRRDVGECLRSSLWLWPSAGAVGGLALAEVLVRVDEAVDLQRSHLVFGGDAGAARAVLGTVAGTTMTVLGVILTLTLAVLTLTANAYSPRVLRTLVRDRLVKAVTAAFVTTFAFSLDALRLVQEGRVPGITVTAAVLLALAALGLLIALFHRLATRIRVESIIAEVHETALEAVAALPAAPEGDAYAPAAAAGGTPVRATRTGRVALVDDHALLRAATEWRRSIEVVVAPGDLVTVGWTVAQVEGDAPLGDDGHERVRSAVRLGRDRTVVQDPTFGLRQLVDIALRALSPGIQDPTTAHEALGRAGDVLRALSGRALGHHLRARDGVHVGRRMPSWAECVGLVLDQPRRAAEQQADVATMESLLRLIAGVVPHVSAGRRPPLERQAGLLRAAAARAVPEPEDRRAVADAAAAALAAPRDAA